MKLFLSAASAALFSLSTAALAVPLTPGDAFVIDGVTSGVTLGSNPELGIASTETVNASANKIRDGFDGFSVIPGLYDVTALVTQEVIAGPDGTIFAYTFDGDTGFSPGDNGYLTLTLTGFAGWAVDIEYIEGTAPFPYLVSRSLDGDEITFGNDFQPLFGEAGQFFLSTDAPSYDFSGGGTAELLLDTFGTEAIDWNRALAAPAAVPLPATALLLLGALGLTTGLRRRG